MLAGTVLVASALLVAVQGFPTFGGAESLTINTKDPLNPYPDGRRLTFNQDGTFKFVLFTDLHYGERGANNTWAQWAVEADAKSTTVMNSVLDCESPDFAVFGGDQITGENTMWENSTANLDNVFEAVQQHRTPFASIYGNHDESYNISHLTEFMYETTRAKAKDLSWTQINYQSSSDPKGAFNYYIPVYATAQSAVPSLLLWFFDSRSGVFNSGYWNIDDEPWMTQDWVDPAVEGWVKTVVADMRKQWGRSNVPKSMAFVHIPPTPAKKIAEKVMADPKTHPGIDFDEPINAQGENTANFWKAPDNPDLPFWRALTGTIGSNDGLIAVTSGHDHGNAWCARDEQLVGPFTFCFGRHTGYGGYGTWDRGARVFEARLSKKHDALHSVKSWVRMEDQTSANTTTLLHKGKTVLINSRDPAPE